MENKNIIIILLIVVVILAAVLGFMFLNKTNPKDSTKIKITSDKSQYEGGKLTLQLTDLNKTAISKEKVNVTVTNKNGKVVVNKTVKTNAKGKASLDLDLKKGKYVVNVTYGGNENYTGNNTTQKLTIKEEVVQSEATSSSGQSSGGSGGYDMYSQQYGTYIKQYTDSNGVQHIEGANGLHETFDPKTGVLSGDDGRGNSYSDYMY